MVKVGRNQPCPCGSGRKAKHCCGVRSGPSDAELARAFVAVEARRAVRDQPPPGEAELDRLVDQLCELPGIDLSLLVPLPPLFRPEIDRLSRAIEEGGGEEIAEAADGALPGVDTPQVRERLARAVLALRDSGRMDAKLAAVALVDLAGGSTLLRASLVEAVAIASGSAETPSGIVIARR